MSFIRKSSCWLLAALFCASATWLGAQSPALVPPGASAAPTNALALPVPALKSPVAMFRQLLAMDPAARKQALANRSAESQRRILAKLREYDSLKADDRELRLRATELRWYLEPMLTMPRTNRAARLALIPAEHRVLVEERLARWDLLPPEVQQQLLSGESGKEYFGQVTATVTDEQRERILNRISPERRARLEAGMKRWHSFSTVEREKMLASFNQFFQLNPAEKQKALKTLSDAERRQMEKTLGAYEKLTPAQRAQCLRSFEKFASLSLAERQLFLKNAERWKLMSPAERENWRRLVDIAPLVPQNRNPLPMPPALSGK